MVVLAKQDRHIGPRQILHLMEVLGLRRQPCSFVDRRAEPPRVNPASWSVLSRVEPPHLRAVDLLADRVRHIEDRGTRSMIDAECQRGGLRAIGRRKVAGEPVEVLARCSAPLVDCLVAVTHCCDRETVSEERAQQLSLRRCSVLILVENDCSISPSHPIGDRPVVGDELMRPTDEIGVVRHAKAGLCLLISGNDPG